MNIFEKVYELGYTIEEYVMGVTAVYNIDPTSVNTTEEFKEYGYASKLVDTYADCSESLYRLLDDYYNVVVQEDNVEDFMEELENYIKNKYGRKMIKELERKLQTVYERTGKTTDDGISVDVKIFDDELEEFEDYIEENDWYWEIDGGYINVNAFNEYD